MSDERTWEDKQDWQDYQQWKAEDDAARANTQPKWEPAYEGWVPVPQSLEYDLITHAMKHGEIPNGYRICRRKTKENP